MTPEERAAKIVTVHDGKIVQIRHREDCTSEQLEPMPVTMTTSPHPAYAGLLADCCAHRHDPGPRLIFADWLEDNAGLLPEREEDWRARCEFVRLQCRLADEPGKHDCGRVAPRFWEYGDTDCARCRWLKSSLSWRPMAAELLARHRHAWLDEEFRRAGVTGQLFSGGHRYDEDVLSCSTGLQQVRGWSREDRYRLTWKWRLGFPDHVSCSWALWDAIGDRVHAAWPVTRVEVAGKRPRVAWHSRAGYCRTALLERNPACGRKAEFTVGEDEFRFTSLDQDKRALLALLRMYWPGVEFTFAENPHA